VDVYGNESFSSLPVAAQTRSKTQSTLPVYEITLPPDSLAALYADPFSDEYVDGNFSYRSDLYPDIGVRFRGNISRNYSKKSWRVNFKSSKPFEGKDKLNIKAAPLDASMIRECLAAFLLKPLAVYSGDCSFVHLQLNSEFLGVFSRVEIPDEDFLRARGLDPAGKLFEAEHPVLGNFSLLPDYGVGWSDDSQNSDGFGALSEFIELINSTPDNSFVTTIASVFNLDAWLDYYAALMLISNFDHTGHNY
jgi:spore coat protein CotH